MYIFGLLVCSWGRDCFCRHVTGLSNCGSVAWPCGERAVWAFSASRFPPSTLETPTNTGMTQGAASAQGQVCTINTTDVAYPNQSK